MRIIPLSLFFILLSVSHAAYVYGDVYQMNLEKLNKTVIRVEGPFSYQLVTNKTNYSIFLSDGEYRISASTFDETGKLIFYTDEKVNVGSNDQKVDLVLRPTNTFDYSSYLIFLAIMSIVFIWANKNLVPRSGATKEFNHEKPLVDGKLELDDETKAVLHMLDGFEGRATQKELKEALNFSDAKLSLILTELEHFGHIKKFKRGRANIIRKLK